jgi:LPXTG-site transpeptidase (sortase) family protein
VGGVYDRPVHHVEITPGPTAAPTPDPGVIEVPPPVVAAGVPPQPYRLIIDRIGVNAPVGVYGLDRQAMPQVPLNGWEVAWYSFTKEPGGGSNAVFAGHVTWNGQAVFYRLDDLKAGDQIRVQRQDGSSLVYTVRDTFLVDADDPKSVSVMGPTSTDSITLITCGGSTYYVGGTFRYDYTHRLIVRAGLSGVQ